MVSKLILSLICDEQTDGQNFTQFSSNELFFSLQKKTQSDEEGETATDQGK